jgi:thiamine biosynthesis lipoprotein
MDMRLILMKGLGWRHQRLLACMALALLTIGAAADEPSRPQRFSRLEIHMGVEFEVVLYAVDAEQGRGALAAAMQRIAELDQILSDYEPTSELSRLSASSVVIGERTAQPFPAMPIGRDLATVLSLSEEISRASQAAFDVTIGPLTKLWRRARRWKELPEPAAIAQARASVGYEFLRLDSRAKTAQLLRPNMRLDLGGIAKGYAAEEAVKTVKARGIADVLVRASGDIVAGDAPPDGSAEEHRGWRIGIAPLDPDEKPTRFLVLTNRAVSTSGDARQHLVVAGRRYSHIIDPRTGQPVSGRSSVTVVAPHGMLADSLATAASVLGPEGALKLIQQFPGSELFMIYEDEHGQRQTVASPGFKAVSP